MDRETENIAPLVYLRRREKQIQRGAGALSCTNAFYSKTCGRVSHKWAIFYGFYLSIGYSLLPLDRLVIEDQL